MMSFRTLVSDLSTSFWTEFVFVDAILDNFRPFLTGTHLQKMDNFPTLAEALVLVVIFPNKLQHCLAFCYEPFI